MMTPYVDGNHTDENVQVVATTFSNSLIISIVYGIIEVFGLCGNILVILTVCSGTHRLQTNYYRLVFHLAVCSIILLLFGNVLFTIGPWLGTRYWSSPLWELSCTVIQPIVSFIFTTELGLLVIIAILRHRAIAQPFQPNVTVKKLKYTIILIYIAPFLINIPTFLSKQTVGRECTNKWKKNIYYYIFDWVLSLVCTLIPMIFLTVLYTKMCYSMARHQRNLRRLFAPEVTNSTNISGKSVANKHYHLRLKNNFKMVIVSMIVLAQFFIAVIPISVLGKLVAHGREEDKFHMIWALPMYLLVSCSFNPIVYGIGDKTIRAGYKTALRKLISCK
ncbi:neuromedin-K receptor-like [Dendronephthya gigantea]|uniref:neuromedin-K receptor-like n=1 Tax=Dendronephthya gigantea TaxID=151771 RepID=UPI0010690FFE|nr:neuromedin-K receptor-like [Dendronephthya gigantea]